MRPIRIAYMIDESDGSVSNKQILELATDYIRIHDVLAVRDAEYIHLQKKFERLYDVLTEIAFRGTSRPRELGEGDDGDTHYRRIAHELISMAANVRREMR